MLNHPGNTCITIRHAPRSRDLPDPSARAVIVTVWCEDTVLATRSYWARNGVLCDVQGAVNACLRPRAASDPLVPVTSQMLPFVLQRLLRDYTTGAIVIEADNMVGAKKAYPDEFCDKLLPRAQAHGVSAAYSLFTTMLNPRFRSGINWRWEEFPIRAADDAGASSWQSFAHDEWQQWGPEIAKAASLSASYAAREILEQSGVLVWWPNADGTPKAGA